MKVLSAFLVGLLLGRFIYPVVIVLLGVGLVLLGIELVLLFFGRVEPDAR